MMSINNDITISCQPITCRISLPQPKTKKKQKIRVKKSRQKIFSAERSSENIPLSSDFFLAIAHRETTRNMGRIFLDHPGGTRLYSCANCDTALTSRSLLTSMVCMR